MSKFINERFLSFAAYTPGEQPQDKVYIKLNTNESPYPPSPEVISSVTDSQIEDLRLYPDPECKELKDALAKSFGVSRENIFVSNGSDDILNFAFTAFGGKGKKAVFPDITYGFYKVYAEMSGTEYEEIPLKDDFSICTDEYLEKDAFVVIANPNAPTGIALGLHQIEKIVAENKENVVLVDEAYIDFGGESAAQLTKKYDNLLVVGTFSKSRSLAGARLGFAVGNKELILDLEKIKYSTNPYSINRLTLLMGTAAVKSSAYYKEKCEEIASTREYTKDELRKMGYTVTDSLANFVFAKKDGISGETIYKKLREKGILVRHFEKARIKDFNRITIGTKKQMEALILALSEIEEELK